MNDGPVRYDAHLPRFGQPVSLSKMLAQQRSEWQTSRKPKPPEDVPQSPDRQTWPAPTEDLHHFIQPTGDCSQCPILKEQQKSEVAPLCGETEQQPVPGRIFGNIFFDPDGNSPLFKHELKKTDTDGDTAPTSDQVDVRREDEEPEVLPETSSLSIPPDPDYPPE